MSLVVLSYAVTGTVIDIVLHPLLDLMRVDFLGHLGAGNSRLGFFYLDLLVTAGNVGQLRTMPDGHNPNRLVFGAIEKPVRPYDDFSIGKLRKLRDDSTRVWKLLQSPKNRFRFLTEFFACNGFVSTNVSDGG